MGLDDLVDGQEEDAKEKKISTKAEKLGVEDQEELDRLDDRLNRAVEGQINNDKRIEDLEEEVKMLKRAVLHLAETSGSDDGDGNGDTSAWR